MLEYIRAKVAEYAVLISWVDHELQSIEIQHPEHHQLIIRLQSKLAEAQDLHDRLKKLVKVGNPRLTRRALPLVHDLEYFIILTTSYYLPALQKEGQADRFLRQLLLSTMKRCGLDWIEDVVVHLDGQHATFSVPSLVETPLIFAPPQHSASLSDMPGLYHEFGHNVFERFSEIPDALGMVVSQYFAGFRKKAGRLTPEQRDERERAVNEALEYWEIKRLSEIFCDIYATFVCGPAHFVSCVDLGLRFDRDPFQIDDSDVHPPMSARVYACYRSLTLDQRNEKVVIAAYNAWKSQEKLKLGNAAFELFCSSALLNHLIEVAIKCIEQMLPAAKRFSVLLSQDKDAEKISEESSLEDILNRGTNLLFTQQERYASWEKEVFKELSAAYSIK